MGRARTDLCTHASVKPYAHVQYVQDICISALCFCLRLLDVIGGSDTHEGPLSP